MERLVRLAEDSPGAEVCGLLVREDGGAIEPWPVTNVAVTPATAFELAPAGLLLALRRLDGSGGSLVAVYHSHLAGGADLSARDLAGALVDGAPLLGGAVQVVVAMEGGRATAIRAHRWTCGEFQPVELWPVRTGHGRQGVA